MGTTITSLQNCSENKQIMRCLSSPCIWKGLITRMYLLCHYKCASYFWVTGSGFRSETTSAALEMMDLSQGEVGHMAQGSRQPLLLAPGCGEEPTCKAHQLSFPEEQLALSLRGRWLLLWVPLPSFPDHMMCFTRPFSALFRKPEEASNTTFKKIYILA